MPIVPWHKYMISECDCPKDLENNILIDCQPSLGMLTVNALAAANRIIVPVQAEYRILQDRLYQSDFDRLVAAGQEAEAQKL